jgi:hypothetical protein
VTKREITVDGELYVRACDSGPIKIVVLERGFVYIGRVDQESDPIITIHSARSIIRWGTTKHLGELVNGPLSNTTLGDPCTVQCRIGQVIHMIEVSQDGWRKHIS